MAHSVLPAMARARLSRKRMRPSTTVYREVGLANIKGRKGKERRENIV